MGVNIAFFVSGETESQKGWDSPKTTQLGGEGTVHNSPISTKSGFSSVGGRPGVLPVRVWEVNSV